MKVGFDLHGVLDYNAEFFKLFTETLRLEGHEVHIVSGARASDILKFCLKTKIRYDSIYSITNDLLDKGCKFKTDKNGNPCFNKKLWDKAKAEYCLKNEIDIMIDDTLEYGKYFKTPFVFLQRNHENRN